MTLACAISRVGGWVVQPCRCCGGLAARRWGAGGAAAAGLVGGLGAAAAAPWRRYPEISDIRLPVGGGSRLGGAAGAKTGRGAGRGAQGGRVDRAKIQRFSQQRDTSRASGNAPGDAVGATIWAGVIRGDPPYPQNPRAHARDSEKVWGKGWIATDHLTFLPCFSARKAIHPPTDHHGSGWIAICSESGPPTGANPLGATLCG